MVWKIIRLELDRTAAFPRGSPSRSYLLTLPLTEAGAVDPQELALAPGEARVRRFWPNQADLTGQIVCGPDIWTFSYLHGFDGDRQIVQPRIAAFRIGDVVIFAEPEGESLPFRVRSIDATG